MKTETTKHTPGPWNINFCRWTPDSSVVGFNITVEGKAAMVAGANTYESKATTAHYSSGELEANARLIAASPDLLEACKAVMRLDYLHEHNALAKQVQDAIAKAEGREK